jgi:hypothetical protein
LIASKQQGCALPFSKTLGPARPTLIALFDAQAPGSGAAIYEAQKGALGPYVDMSMAPWSAYQPALTGVLTQAYQAEGLDTATASVKAASDLAGKVSAFVFNQPDRRSAPPPSAVLSALRFQRLPVL